MKTPPTESELKAQKDKIQAELYKIEGDRRRAENTPLVGRCFKYRNSYGSGKKWWLYMKVIAISKCGFHLSGVSFQNTGLEMSSRVDKCMYGVEGYVEISAREYREARLKFIADIEKSIPVEEVA